MTERLPTHFWVDALIRRTFAQGCFATLLRRGDDERGMVYVRLQIRRGLDALLVPSFRIDNALAFRVLLQNETLPDKTQIDDYIQRQVSNDPDLWIVEVESRTGQHFITEPVEGMERVLASI